MTYTRVLNNKFNYSVKNKYGLVEKIKNINIIKKGCKMISHHVQIMYTSIPKLKALNIPKNKLFVNNNFNSKEMNEKMHVIINQNNF